MSYLIDQKKIDLIHKAFRQRLKIGKNPTPENVYYSVSDIQQMKREESRLKTIVKNLHEEDRTEYKQLLNELTEKINHVKGNKKASEYRD